MSTIDDGEISGQISTNKINADELDNWKTMITQAMGERGESWGDVESNTMTNEEMEEEFYSGYGFVSSRPFTVWTKNTVYFPVAYDGAESVGHVSRNPDGMPTEHK